MTWLAWRQIRAQVALVAAATAAVLVTLAVTRHHVAATAGDLTTGYQSLRLLGTALIGVPALIGAFWGAPLVARELEAGTHRLVWTQSVTRARWLATKLGVIGAAAALLTALFSLTFTWWSLPIDELGNRIGTANFGQRGIAPIAYVVFALALGTLLGLVIGRTLPAMATTMVGFFVVRFAVQLLVRPHLGSPITVTRPTETFGVNAGQTATSGAWVLSSHTADAAGHHVSQTAVDNAVARACPITRSTGAADLARCAHRLGFQDVVRVQPASRFWVLQSWEAAIFLLLAVILGGLCFWWIQHRTA